MENIRIESNPYKNVVCVQRENYGTYVDFSQDSTVRSHYEEPLQNIIDSVLEKINKQYKGIEHITLCGTAVDFDDCKNSANRISPSIIVSHEQQLVSGKEAFDTANAEFDRVNNLLEKYVHSHDADNTVVQALQKLEKLKKPEVFICFLGNYSAGKSTLINSLIGRDILPTAKGAETKCIWKIRKSNGDYFSINGNIVSDEKQLKEKIEQLCEVDEVVVSVPFIGDSLLDSEIDYVFVDTPGSDNDNDMGHIECLTSYLKCETNSLPIIVVTADKLTSPTFKTLLSIVNSNQEGINFLRGIFVVNDWGGDDGLEKYKPDFLQVCDDIQTVSQNAEGKIPVMGISKKMVCTNPLYAMARRANVEKQYAKINPNFIEQYERSVVSLVKYGNNIDESTHIGENENTYLFNTGIFALENEINLYAQRYSYFDKAARFIAALTDAIVVTKKQDETDRGKKEKDIKDKIEGVAKDIICKISEAKKELSKINEDEMCKNIEAEYKARKKKHKEEKKSKTELEKKDTTQKSRARDLLVEATNACYAHRLSKMRSELEQRLVTILNYSDSELKKIIEESSLQEEAKRELGNLVAKQENVMKITADEKEYVKRILFFVKPDYKKAVQDSSNAWLSIVGKVEKECKGLFTKKYEKLLDLSKEENKRCVYRFSDNQFIAELTKTIGELEEVRNNLSSLIEFKEA